jgi:hypothetical protein
MYKGGVSLVVFFLLSIVYVRVVFISKFVWKIFDLTRAIQKSLKIIIYKYIGIYSNPLINNKRSFLNIIDH